MGKGDEWAAAGGRARALVSSSCEEVGLANRQVVGPALTWISGESSPQQLTRASVEFNSHVVRGLFTCSKLSHHSHSLEQRRTLANSPQKRRTGAIGLRRTYDVLNFVWFLAIQRR